MTTDKYNIYSSYI